MDEDFSVIKICSKLDQFFVSLTAISSAVIVKISEKLDLISLNACAVPFSITECKKGVQNVEHLTFFNLSIKDTNTSEFDAVIKQISGDCCFSVYSI